MSKIAVEISDKYKPLIDSNPDVIDILLSQHIELEQDKNTKNKLINNETDIDLNINLKKVLWI